MGIAGASNIQPLTLLKCLSLILMCPKSTQSLLFLFFTCTSWLQIGDSCRKRWMNDARLVSGCCACVCVFDFIDKDSVVTLRKHTQTLDQSLFSLNEQELYGKFKNVTSQVIKHTKTSRHSQITRRKSVEMDTVYFDL